MQSRQVTHTKSKSKTRYLNELRYLLVCYTLKGCRLLEEKRGGGKGVVRKGCFKCARGRLGPTSKHSLPLRNSLVSKNAQVSARLPEGHPQFTLQEKRPPTTVKTKTKVGCRLHYISKYSNPPDCKEARQHRSLATGNPAQFLSRKPRRSLSP